MAYQIVKISS